MVWFTLTVATAAMAAPVGTGDSALLGPLPVASEASRAAPDGLAAPSATATVPESSGSKTVDLLIELQGRAQGSSVNGMPATSAASGSRSRRTDTAGRQPPPLPQTQQAQQTPQTLHFGGLFSPTASAAQADQIAAFNPGSEAERPWTVTAGGDGKASAPGLLRWLAWPREAVGFIREHRHWVLAGVVAMLALLWLRTPGARSRRR